MWQVIRNFASEWGRNVLYLPIFHKTFMELLWRRVGFVRNISKLWSSSISRKVNMKLCAVHTSIFTKSQLSTSCFQHFCISHNNWNIFEMQWKTFAILCSILKSFSSSHPKKAKYKRFMFFQSLNLTQTFSQSRREEKNWTVIALTVQHVVMNWECIDNNYVESIIMSTFVWNRT